MSTAVRQATFRSVYIGSIEADNEIKKEHLTEAPCYIPGGYLHK